MAHLRVYVKAFWQGHLGFDKTFIWLIKGVLQFARGVEVQVELRGLRGFRSFGDSLGVSAALCRALGLRVYFRVPYVVVIELSREVGCVHLGCW